MLKHDVVIVGAGPAGAGMGYYLAKTGLRVLILDKSDFPRDKVCGDGLTPVAVRELDYLGIDYSTWKRNYGLRMVSLQKDFDYRWPENDRYPDFGLARSRMKLDYDLLQHAIAAGAEFRSGVHVTKPLIDAASGNVRGVSAWRKDASGKRSVETYEAEFVVASDGAGGKLGNAIGWHRKNNWPMGVAVRGYFESSLHQSELMHSYVQLRDEQSGALLPGYGWIFPVDSGLVNVGLGSVSARGAATKVDYRRVMRTWVAQLARDFDLVAVSPVRGAALPMAIDRPVLAHRGLVLTGDAAGMISPFNGEGIGYALRCARFGAPLLAAALEQGSSWHREQLLQQYSAKMLDDLGGYFQLGRVFVNLIENPKIMALCVKYGFSQAKLMSFVVKLLSDCYSPTSGQLEDRIIYRLNRVIPRL